MSTNVGAGGNPPDDSGPIVEAIKRLTEVTSMGFGEQSKYFENLQTDIKDLASALGKEKKITDDNRRGSNAYAKAREFMQLPEDKRRQARWQYKYGVLNEEGTPATGRYSLRRNVGLLNLPEAHQLLQEGHFQQAGYQVASGLVRSPYSRPFTYPTAIRLGAQGLDLGRNRVMAQRLGQPNALGMTTGAMGPGAEDFTGGLGSYVASLTAFPSMFASKTGEPYSMFGGSLAPAVSQGYQMRKEAFMRSLNPFSMMGYQQNLNIIESTASKGFRSLGESFGVSNVVRDLVQKVGIDAGTAIDTLDLAIKRLGMDAEDAQEQMEMFGTMARGAGKGVAQFAKETLDVLNQMSLQNTRGGGALSAAALMSGVPQVSGQGVFNLMNSPTMTGLMMGNMASQGASMSTLTAMAMGYPFSAGGGRASLEMMSQGFGTFRQYVDQFMQSAPGETPEDKKQFAFNMAAQVFGLDGPMTAQRIYDESKQKIAQAEVSTSLQDFKNVKSIGADKYMREQLGMTKGKGFGGKAGKAFQQLRKTFQSGREQYKGGRGEKPGIEGAAPGMFFSDPSGQNSFQFNNFVKRYISALRFGTENENDVYEEAKNAGIDPEQVKEAANLYVASGRGDEKYGRAAFAKLSSKYNVNMATGEKFQFLKDTSFSTKQLREASQEKWSNMSGQEKQQYIKLGTNVLDKALEKNLINESYYKKQMELIKKGQFDTAAFEEKIMGTSAQKTLTGSREMFDLTDDAKKLLKLLPNREGSERPNG